MMVRFRLGTSPKRRDGVASSATVVSRRAAGGGICAPAVAAGLVAPNFAFARLVEAQAFPRAGLGDATGLLDGAVSSRNFEGADGAAKVAAAMSVSSTVGEAEIGLDLGGLVRPFFGARSAAGAASRIPRSGKSAMIRLGSIRPRGDGG